MGMGNLFISQLKLMIIYCTSCTTVDKRQWKQLNTDCCLMTHDIDRFMTSVLFWPLSTVWGRSILDINHRRRFGSWQSSHSSILVVKPSDINTLRTGDADLRFYITTVQDGWRKICVFNTRFFFPCTIHLIMQYIEPVSEWSCWRMFVETWPHSELSFRHRASSI